MSLRIMSDLDLSSSDEEIFDGSPSTKSANTSLNSTNSGRKQTINNNFVIKDVSVKVTQLPIVKSEKHKKNTHKDTQIKKRKRVVRKWRNGIITRKKENSSKRIKPITLKLVENKTEEHAQDQSRIIEEKSTDVHQKLQLAKSCISKNLEISDEKKDTEVDQTYTSARILPYDFYRNKNMPTTTKYFNLPPSLNDENLQLEQYLREKDMSEDAVSCLIQRILKAHRQLQESELERKKLYKQLLKKKKTVTDKELLSTISSLIEENNDIDTDESDSSVEFQPALKKRRRRISSSESSDNIIDNNNSNRSYLSYEGTKQAKSQIKIREVKIILTKIEDMIKMDTIKQKQGEDASKTSKCKSTVPRQLNTEKVRKSSIKMTSEKENSYITVKDQETVQRQNNELILTRNDGPSQTKDISNDSRLSITSNTHVQRNLKQSDDLYIRKLKKRYKLFKKPRVLLIKLETLQISVKNNQYSASEVERLTKKYINFVIKSNRFTSRTSYGFRQLQNKSTDVNIVHTVDDNASVNSQNVTKNSTEFAERSPTKDNKSTENNGVKATSLKKFPLSNNLMSMIPIDQYKLLQLHKNKISVSPEKKQEDSSSQKLLKIWQNAFCKKSTEQSQKTTAKKQSASLQSPSVSQDSSKNSADTKFTSVSNHVASTSLSSTKDDASATCPKKVGSPKKQAETAGESAECETVFESLTNCVNLLSNESIEKTTSKNSPLQQNNKQIPKNLLDNKNDKNIASRSCLNLTRKITENAEKDSLKSPRKSSAKSKNSTSLVRKTKSPRSKTSLQVSQISCKMTKITFKCAKCNIVFEQFRAWQEHHLYLCKQNAIVDSSSGNVLKQQNVESLNLSISQKTSNNTESNSSSSQQTLTNVTCRSCLKVFDNNFQYFEHLKQTNCQFKRVCPIDKTASTSQKTDEQNDQASKSILKKVIELRAPEKTAEVIENKLGNTLRDNAKESNAKKLVTSKVSHDASIQRNETSNLPKTTEQNKQSIPAIQETENHDDEEKRQAPKPVAICKCHRNIKIVQGENIPIEIVLQCTCCHVLFRLLECFEAHCQSSVFPSCASNSQNNRKAKLFCNICQVMMNSLNDMYRHLVIHAKINRKGTVTFRCNICKLSFYGLGPLFNAHFNNHEKSPGFKSKHQDFPANTYVGSRVIRMPSADNEKQMNIYYEVADHICPKCKTPFYTPLALRLHMVTCNVGNVSAVNNNASSTVAKTSTKKKQLILICGFCNKKFCNKAVFDQHSSEHKQKRELNSYYTCVTVTAITKVYICKVCTSMWQSLEKFEEHWRTHGELREDYVCSICESHFNAFDLFEKHTITHKKSVSCKVIYRDVNEQNSTTHRQDNNNLSLASVSSCHEETESIGEKSVTSDKVLSVVTPRKSVIKKSLCEKQNQPIETTAPVSDSISSTDITQKSTEAKKNTTTISTNDCTKIDNNAKKNNNNKTNNLDNLEDSDEDNLVIALSDEENTTTVSNIVVGNTTNNVPLIEHNDDTEKRRAATSNSAATVEQQKQSTNLESVVSSAAISSATNVSEGASNVITQGETNAQLDKSSDVSGNKETCVNDTNVRSSKTAQDTRANDAIVHPVIIDVVSLNENSKELSNNDINTKSKESSNNDTSTEPKNLSKDKSTENKTFLRVKSLAELTNTPLRSHICYECGQPFDCVQKLTEHIAQHDTERRKQASLFNPPIFLAQTPNLAPQPRVPPPSTVSSNQSQQHPILSATSRQYQVIGVKPLHLVAYTVVENKKVSPNVLQYEVPWNPQKNTSAVVTQPSMIQQPTCQPISQVSHQANKLIQNNNIQQITLVQQQQQQQNTSTVAVRPFMQNFNQGSVSQSVLYVQQQRQQRQLQQWQHQQRQQQQLRQQEIQQQRLQQQQLLQQQRQLHQQQQLKQQILQQQHQRLQQQQQLQQRQHDNAAVHNQYLAPQRNVSPLAQNNTVPAYPANNNASGDLNMIQQAKTPENLTCLYCPGFECSSIHDFAAHLRSPKHEARSHYNDVPYSS